jgi:serine/threonine protein kinase
LLGAALAKGAKHPLQFVIAMVRAYRVAADSDTFDIVRAREALAPWLSVQRPKRFAICHGLEARDIGVVALCDMALPLITVSNLKGALRTLQIPIEMRAAWAVARVYEAACAIGECHSYVPMDECTLSLDSNGEALIVPPFTWLQRFGQAGVTGRARSKAYSVSWLASEQVLGRASTEQTNVYTLGVALYQLLCDESPFEALSDSNILTRLTTERCYPRLTILGALDTSLFRALSPVPEQRFASVSAFADALHAIVQAGEDASTKWQIARYASTLAESDAHDVHAWIDPCPRKWEDLTVSSPSQDDHVRYCNQCNLHVHRVSESRALLPLLAEGRCVSVLRKHIP